MKNIFRKAVQKVRNTTAKVFDAMYEHPEVYALGLTAIAGAVGLGVVMHQSKKEAEWLNNCVDAEDLPSYNVTTVLNAVQHAHDAFKASYEADPEAVPNLVKYGCTREDARCLEQIGLATGSDTNFCQTWLYYEPSEQQLNQTENTDA